MSKPLDFRYFGLGLAVVVTSLSTVHAGTYDSPTGGLSSTAEREVVRRQQDLLVAEDHIKKGDRAMAEKDYESAYTHYLDAVDLIGSGPAVATQRKEALSKFSKAGVAYANHLIENGRYSDAEMVAKTILLPQYNPTYQPAITLLSNLEQPDYYNKTVSPQFAADRERVAELLVEAEGFYSRGSYDHAIKRYEQVLNIDPYNIAARRGMEKVNEAKGDYYTEARNETRARMLWQVTKGWEMPVRRFIGGKDTVSTVTSGRSQTEAITEKLNRIIIPNLDLRDTTVREAVEYLRQLSVRLDTTESDNARKGVNIFLKLGSGAGVGAASILPTPGEEGEAAPMAPAVTEDTRITLALNNVPLYEALRYLASLAGLKIKVEPYAVSIVPLTDVSNELITKEYKVPPTFIPSREAPTNTDPFGSFGQDQNSGPRVLGRLGAQEFLESQGVVFPPGASAQYIPAGSKLVVRNTQDNIDLIDLLVDSAQGGAPTQVEIESKFVEINQDNLKELGFDWLLGPLQIGGSNSGVYGAGGSLGANSNVFPFVSPSGNVVGTNQVTRGLRSGQGTGSNSAVTINSLDSLLGGPASLLSGPAPGIFSLAGVYTNPQFQMVIRALDQKKGVDLMSAPKVTTKSGARAVVNVIREFRYPTEFDPPQIPQDTQGSGYSGASGFTTQPIVTPTTPASFETRNIGVTLEVTPVVGPDNYTIELDLAPEVVDFEGFINYGVPILGLASSTPLGAGIPGPPRSVEVSPNVINQPVFSTRKVTTNVTIWDGMTIALGGLIREDVQKVQDKVPLLGDVPLVGRLFRSDVDQKLKKNLIIFVTARLMDAEGRPVRSDLDEEEIVEPLGLPDEIPPPTLQFKGPSMK